MLICAKSVVAPQLTTQGPLLKTEDPGYIAPNGRRYATLPEPKKRARDKDLRGFAGEGNVVERSERYASEAKPEEPEDTKRRARDRLVRCWIFSNPKTLFPFALNARRAKREVN